MIGWQMCKDCDGSSLCEHGRVRSRCKDCGGSGLCEHGREHSRHEMQMQNADILYIFCGTNTILVLRITRLEQTIFSEPTQFFVLRRELSASESY